MSASDWRQAMNAGSGRRAMLSSRPAAAVAVGGVAMTPPGVDDGSPRWLRYLWRHVRARHVFVLLLVLGYPLVASPFFTFQIGAQALALGIIALSLSFLGGYGGMISLAQMTVAGIAGYAVAILGVSGTESISLGWPWYVVVPFAVVIATVAGTLIGWLSVRTEGIYTIMITLAVGVAFHYLVLQNYSVFGGFQGLQRVYPPHVFGIDWRSPVPFYYLCLAVALAAYFFVRYVVGAPFGVALQGIRDNPRRMNSLGFAVTGHRVAAYALAGLIAAAGGVLLHLVQRPHHAGLGGHVLAHQRPGDRRAGRHAPSDRRLPRRDRVRAAAELRDRPVRSRAFQPGHRWHVPRHRALFPGRTARTLGTLLPSFRREERRRGGRERTRSRIRGPFDALTHSGDHKPLHLEGGAMKAGKRWFARTLVGAAVAAALGLSGGAMAQQTIKVGLLATLEGPFAAGGADGMRGAELALRERNGMVAGKKIELIKASSDAKPDVAVNATRKLVEQDKVQIMVGPLSGGEGIAVKDYSKTQPNVTFINGGSGAQATTLVNPSPNFFRFNTEGAQWMVGLGNAAYGKGYKRMMVIAEDYAFPYSQVQGFMTEYCKAGGKVPLKAWVPLGGKDYASVIARIPKDVDALLVVLGGADAVNFLNQYEQAGGDKPMVGGSITVSQDVLNYRGKRRESLLGTMSAGPLADAYDGAGVEEVRRRLQEELPGRLSEPLALRLRLLHEHEGGARRAGDGERRPVGRRREVPPGAVDDDAEDADRRREARPEPAGDRLDLRHRGREGRQGQLLQQGRAQDRQRQPDARHPGGGVQDRLAGRSGLPVRPTKVGERGAGAMPASGAAPSIDAGNPTWTDRNMASVVAPRMQDRDSIATGNALELEGVSRSFGALAALDDVTFSVAAGERRAVIGANGAGKTTLFNVITGDFPATAGRVRFFGDDVTELPPHERIRAGLRRTYQSSLLFRELSVRDNLFLAVRGVARGRMSLVRPRAGSTTRAAAEDLLRRVRLERIADERVSALSHGQQRQLEIGMALAGAPRLILFDEPAAGLSPAERRELVAILGALPAHMGFVLIEHDLEIALRVVDRVTVMHNGRVLKHGTPAEIENDAEVQAIYMGGKH